MSTTNLKRRVIRDWLAIDYAIFDRVVSVKEGFNADFDVAWKIEKRNALKEFYESLELMGILDSNCCVESVREEAKSIGRKARKFAILRLKKIPVNVVKEIASIYAYDKNKSLVKATKLLMAHESIGNLMGGHNTHTKNMCKILALALK